VIAAAAAIVTVYRVWENIDVIGARMIKWSHHTGPLRPIGRSLVESLGKILVVGHLTNSELTGGLTVCAVVAAGYLSVAATWAYWQKQDAKRFYRRRRESKMTDPLGGRELILFVYVLVGLSFVAGSVGWTRDYSQPWAWAKAVGWWWMLVVPVVWLSTSVLAWALRGGLRLAERKLMELTPRDQPPAQPSAEPEGFEGVPATGTP
jgi:hypothetical protein